MTLAVGVMPAVTKLFCAPLSNIKNKLIVDIEETRKNISIVPANTPPSPGGPYQHLGGPLRMWLISLVMLGIWLIELVARGGNAWQTPHGDTPM